MLALQIAVVGFMLVFGIPSQIIDYKHRKRDGYEPGNAWGYYAKLSKEGSREGRFMIWTGYLAIAIVLSALAYLFFALSS